jgi:hypothetical protein
MASYKQKSTSQTHFKTITPYKKDTPIKKDFYKAIAMDDDASDNDNESIECKELTPEQMLEMLICKLTNRPCVNIETIKKEKAGRRFYDIRVKHINLKYYGDMFHSATFQTLSHSNRIINISILFSDNDARHAMIVENERDIVDIFYDIGGTTVDSVLINKFTDSNGFKHMTVSATSIKGASLIHTYTKSLEFIKEINCKYGTPAASSLSSTTTAKYYKPPKQDYSYDDVFSSDSEMYNISSDPIKPTKVDSAASSTVIAVATKDTSILSATTPPKKAFTRFNDTHIPVEPEKCVNEACEFVEVSKMDLAASKIKMSIEEIQTRRANLIKELADLDAMLESLKAKDEMMKRELVEESIEKEKKTILESETPSISDIASPNYLATLLTSPEPISVPIPVSDSKPKPKKKLVLKIGDKFIDITKPNEVKKAMATDKQ